MNKFLAPAVFYQVLTRVLPFLVVGLIIFLAYGIISGLFLAPVDYQQKEAVKLMYIHVPCALLSLSIYTIIGVLSAVYLIWKVKIADILAQASAPIGASITALALISGALWGKPMWGTWWVWDARLTSELILLFLYCGYIGLRAAITDVRIAATAAAVLAIVGLIDIPIIHFSVEWWQTLHQGASISKFAKPSIAPEMLYPLLSMLLGLYFLYALILCVNARTEILWRERNSSWVKQLVLRLSENG